MNTTQYQYVYALTCEQQDYYFANMTRLSLMSLRLYNSEAKIIIVCDNQTYQNLQEDQHWLINHCDQMISVDTPNGSGTFRNRFLKTTLRQYITGSFLYLDADTLIRDNLKAIFDIQTDFAAAPNHSGTGNPLEMPADEYDNFVQLGWKIPDRYYVNGGVLFFADTSKTHEFSRIWHQKWLNSTKKMGRARDQPSLNSALFDSKASFTWLPHEFNAQIDARPNLAPSAKLWHLYNSNGQYALNSIFYDYLEQLQQRNDITYNNIEKLTLSRHPWPVRNFIEWWCIQRLLLAKQPLDWNSFERLWMSGHDQDAKVLFMNDLRGKAEPLFTFYINLPRPLRSVTKSLIKSLLFLNK